MRKVSMLYTTHDILVALQDLEKDVHKERKKDFALQLLMEDGERTDKQRILGAS